MKKFLAIPLALVLVLSLTSCGRTTTQSLIASACKMAGAKIYKEVETDFETIAARDPGYIKASMGARLWAENQGDWRSIYSGHMIAPGGDALVFESIEEFTALCGTSITP